MEKGPSLKVKLFGIFVFALGVIALFSAYHLKTHKADLYRSHVQLIRSVDAQGRFLLDHFMDGDQRDYKSIRRLFFHNFSLLRRDILQFKDKLSFQIQIRNVWLSLFMGLAGIYYIFTALGLFWKNFQTYPRLKMAVLLWTITLVIALTNTYFATMTLHHLINRIQILSYYAAVPFPHNSFSLQPFAALYPRLFAITVFNVAIYIFLPVWYIRRLQNE
jgi:hypothetical protein